MLRTVPPWLTPVAVATLVVLALLAAVSTLHGGRADPAPGAALDGADRIALGAVPVRRGPPPSPVDPAVDLTDPAAVARAYLVGARTARPDDDGRTHRQAAGYAAPGSPPAAVGVLVLDPPPSGQVRSAAVTALDLVARDDADSRRGYRARITTTTAGVGTLRGTAVTSGGTAAVSTAYVVLTRQPDGRWLVTADTTDLPDGDD